MIDDDLELQPGPSPLLSDFCSESIGSVTERRLLCSQSAKLGAGLLAFTTVIKQTVCSRLSETWVSDPAGDQLMTVAWEEGGGRSALV